MKINMILSAMVLAYSGLAAAENPESYITDSGIAITPVVSTGLKYDDNIFSQGTDTTASGIFTIAPAVKFSLDDGINNYHLDVGIESGTYLQSSDDNYVTGNLAFKSHLEASSQSRFDLLLEVKKEVEPRGTGITEGLGDTANEPLSYNDQRAKLTYEYGSLSSNASIEVEGGYYNKNYTNFTDITQYRSFDQPTLGATFFYSTNASTDAFVEVKGSTIDYDKNTDISRDSKVFSALIGVKWEATALTSGSFKIGQEQKNFTDNAREDFKGISWEGTVDWKPLTYTTVSLNTSRSAKDPDVQGDYISESVYGVSWQHEWSKIITSNLNFSYRHEDYSGIKRLDKTNDLYLDVIYQIKRNVNVSLFVEYTDKSSTVEAIEYDKNIIGLNFTLSL